MPRQKDRLADATVLIQGTRLRIEDMDTYLIRLIDSIGRNIVAIGKVEEKMGIICERIDSIERRLRLRQKKAIASGRRRT